MSADSTDDEVVTLLASRVGRPVSESQAIMRKRRDALEQKAAALAADSARRAELAAEAKALQQRIHRPSWSTSNEAQNARQRLRD